MPETSAIPSLEQQRARHAWKQSEGCSKDYMNLAKGLPALIMNSGLMQVMAFLEQKRGHHSRLAKHLRDWLIQCKKLPTDCLDFKQFMDALLNAEPRQFQEITTEAMAWLRWMRQMAAARHVKNGGHSDDKS